MINVQVTLLIAIILMSSIFTNLASDSNVSYAQQPLDHSGMMIAIFTPKWTNDIIQVLRTNLTGYSNNTYIASLSGSPPPLDVFSKLPDERKIIGGRSLDGLSKAINISKAAGVKPDVVLYDIEHWDKTPLAERNDPVGSISKAADIAHQAGFGSGVAPDKRFLLQYYKQIDWHKIDFLVMQLQSIANNVTEYSANSSLVADFVKSENPSTKVFVQASLVKSDPSQIAAAASSVRNIVDGILVFYNPKAPQCAACDIEGLSGIISNIRSLNIMHFITGRHTVNVYGRDFEILSTTNSTVTNFGFDRNTNQLEIRVNSTKTGFIELAIPKIMMAGQFAVALDGKPIPVSVRDNNMTDSIDLDSGPSFNLTGQSAVELANQSFSIIQLVHDPGQHTISISATQVVPEFPGVGAATTGIIMGSAIFMKRWLLKD